MPVGIYPRKFEDPVVRFWRFVEKSDGCWNWKGPRLPKGYGTFKVRVNGKWETRRAPRVAWELANGPIPDGQWVLHHCDNPACVKTEPDTTHPTGHLFLGTNSDNIADKVSKGRCQPQDRERNPNAKLTVADVAELRKSRAAGTTLPALASRFGICLSQVKNIVYGHSWPICESEAV